MGLLSRSASFVRYAVEGDLPENFWEFASERIARFSFKDIDDSYEERSVGWVSVLNMFDSEFAFASYAAGDNIALSLRIDERKVSPKLLKKFCLKEEERLKKERQIPKLNRTQLLEIKENVKLMLMKKAVPMPAVYDLCWNLAEGTLLFFTTSQKAQETLEEFFRDTFDLSIILQVPYLVAEHMLAAGEQDALADISPSIFV
jgi:DNA recombination-dependent growth factor C